MECPHPATCKSFTSALRSQARFAHRSLVWALLLTVVPQQAGAAADLWQLYQDRGTLAYSQGRAGEAEQLFEKAIAEAKKAQPADVRLADSLSSLATVYLDARRYEESERSYRQAMTIYESPALGCNRPDRAQCLEGFARLLRQTERGQEAANVATAARTIWERLWANATYEAIVAEDNQDLSGAERAFRAALQYSEHFPPQYGRMLGTLENLVSLLDKQGRSVEAEPFCKDALSICEKVFGPGHKKTTSCRAVYERLQQKNHGSSPGIDAAPQDRTESPAL